MTFPAGTRLRLTATPLAPRCRPWWDTVVQNSEAICRQEFAKTRERVPHRHLRLIDAAGMEVETHAPICWRTPYQGTGDLRCERRPGHRGLHKAEGQVWSRCNGPVHGEGE